MPKALLLCTSLTPAPARIKNKNKKKNKKKTYISLAIHAPEDRNGQQKRRSGKHGDVEG
jgi:hypothetical protein